MLSLQNTLVYLDLKSDPQLTAFEDMRLSYLQENISMHELMHIFTELASDLITSFNGISWTDIIIYKIIKSVNRATQKWANSAADADCVKLNAAVRFDLDILQDISSFNFHNFWLQLSDKLDLATSFANKHSGLFNFDSPSDNSAIVRLYCQHEAALELRQLLLSNTAAGSWSGLLHNLQAFYEEYASGDFIFHNSFRPTADGRHLEALEAEQLKLDIALSDYNNCLGKLKANTELFLSGKTAENCLLYGPKGTGKSSSVAALPKLCANHKLKLFELRKQNIKDLAFWFEQLGQNRLRYIFYIDDLSLEADEEDFVLLKNILEGSIVRQPENILLYVSSNRRHIVKENFDDTEKALYAEDVRSERLSLAERFGLSIRFSMPNKQQYLDIIYFLLKTKGFELSPEKIELIAKKAMIHAANSVNMSPRSATQFVRKIITSGELDG